MIDLFFYATILYIRNTTAKRAMSLTLRFLMNFTLFRVSVVDGSGDSAI